MSQDKASVIKLLKQEYANWETKLDQLNETRVVTASLPNGWSIKDLMAHLMAWQQVSLARLRAARAGGEPDLPTWLEGESPEFEPGIHKFNAKIYERYKQTRWSEVYEGWKDGFAELIALGEAISEDELSDKTKFPWLEGFALMDVLVGTHEHHNQDHWPKVEAVLEKFIS